MLDFQSFALHSVLSQCLNLGLTKPREQHNLIYWHTSKKHSPNHLGLSLFESPAVTLQFAALKVSRFFIR